MTENLVVPEPDNREWRLAEIKAWRARFRVHPDLAGLTREQALEEVEPGLVPVFQHTVDDYDFLLGEVDFWKAEIKKANEAIEMLGGHPLTYD